MLVFVLLKVFSLSTFYYHRKVIQNDVHHRKVIQNDKTHDVHAYVITGRIIAVYIHFMLVGFNPHVLPTIRLH